MSFPTLVFSRSYREGQGYFLFTEDIQVYLLAPGLVQGRIIALLGMKEDERESCSWN